MPEHEFLAPQSQRMTNEDFRKLMMTPRGGSGSSATPVGALGAAPMTPKPENNTGGSFRQVDSEKAEKRKKKKSYYAKLKKQEDDKMAELAAKYRDRARERRDGTRDGQGGEDDSTTSAYRAVAPDVRSNFDAAERRKKMIQESKFLGGDMEHTHLVKGLDFALLQKVRSEIQNSEKAGEESGEVDQDEAKKVKTKTNQDKEKQEEEEEEIRDNLDPYDELQSLCRTAMARNVVRSLFNPNKPKVNELFFPGRMAYVIDLEEEFAESDIPTTTIRSKADLEGTVTQQTTLSTNDIVINKLTQILSYLRAGSKNRKNKKDKHIQAMKREDELLREQQQKAALADMPIYEDVDHYNPKDSSKHRKREHKSRGSRHHDRDRDRDRDSRRDRDYYYDKHEYKRRDNDEGSRSKRASYFDKPAREDDYEDRKEHSGGLSKQDKDYIRKLTDRERQKEKLNEDSAKGGVGLAKVEPEGYAECYPGLEEMNDAIDDSDDEADYTKMDLGNKKGPVGRWDFDTPEEYADYMSKKEALPKAAFQYGVKMNEGRKTRGKVGTKNEKAKLDREWTKISAIIDKRKGGPSSGGSSSKKPKVD